MESKDKDVKRFSEFLEKAKDLFEEYGIEGFVWARFPGKDMSAMVSDIQNVEECIKSYGLNLVSMHRKYFEQELPLNFVKAIQVAMLGSEACKQFLSDMQKDSYPKIDKSMLN